MHGSGGGFLEACVHSTAYGELGQKERRQPFEVRLITSIERMPSLRAHRMYTCPHQPRKRIAGAALFGRGDRPSLEGVASALAACSPGCAKAQLRLWRWRHHRDRLASHDKPCVSAACGGCLRMAFRSTTR